ncbi:MAG: PorT family protein [Bacteroidaceae bacterium]|nr:PorT family protein [Bacteroidaceae bacterium]
MKSIKVLLLALALIPDALMAQVGEHRNDFAIGGSIGYTLNSVNFVPTIKQKQKGDMMFGFAARYTCEKYFTAICGVQAEVNFWNLGWEENIEDGTNNTYRRSLNYVQVPILMQMGWGRERRGMKFIFEAGPQLGYYLGGSSEKGGGVWDTSHRPNNVTFQYDNEPYNKLDYGIAAGIGAELSTAVGHFIVSGRYYYGLADIFDNSKKGVFGRSANATICAKLTYLFDIVKTKDDKIR